MITVRISENADALTQADRYLKVGSALVFRSDTGPEFVDQNPFANLMVID